MATEPLLAAAIEAHGGAAWAGMTALTARIHFGGPFWGLRGDASIVDDVRITVWTGEQRVRVAPFPAAGQRIDLAAGLDGAPTRAEITGDDGALVEARDDPRASFPLPFDALTTRWDPIQVAWFAGFANWTYLTVPFSLTRPGVEVHELEPWQPPELGGTTWRRLAVTFPEGYVGHNRDQVLHFDADELLLRRNDYSPYVTSSPPIAHEVGEYREFEGLRIPTRRRVYRHDDAGVADHALAVIEEDVLEVTVERA